MCGIVAVLSRPSSRPVPDGAAVLGRLGDAVDALTATAGGVADPAALAAAAGALEAVDADLRGVPGLACLLSTSGPASTTVAEQLAASAGRLGLVLDRLEADLDAAPASLPAAVEQLNATIVRLRDAWWALTRDRAGAAADVAALAPAGVDPANGRALEALWALDVALRAIDRLEVRGRDSAGVHVLVTGHGLDLDAPATAAMLGARLADPLFTSMAVRTPGGALSLVYKAAAEIGELGDNVAALRAAIRSDPLLGAALASPSVTATVLGHTRWASVGVISQANAHPLNSDEPDRPGAPYVTAALNGDVDNHNELRALEGIATAPEITTDAKVIPALVSRRLADGVGAGEAFRETVARFEGSVAIAASVAADPDRLELALRGSGQSLYIGLADDAFVVSSEPYGLVEQTRTYVRMDGEATGGQVVTLDRSEAGELAGMERRAYDGTPLPLGAADVVTAEITTRDIDRAGFPHFLLKEISESPSSFRKTLRGKVDQGGDGRLTVALPPEALPGPVVDALAGHRVRRVVVIGQGTAAVAGRAVADAIAHCLPDLQVQSSLATELSGFGLDDDMSETLVVAISQSGTTTDTNRTVDLVRGRGALVLAVVNRRNSDLATKAHGTLYTSDGRDVEMSVASTKAFYAQVAAGWLLALGLASASGCADPEETDRLLRALRGMPAAMEQVIGSRAVIGRAAAVHAPPRRHWAVVGSGPDRVAAAEVRIKLSELCYRSIACDATEDKKHIDLSSEPLIVVCAASLSGATADDIAKEVAIYQAHKAAPVVIAAAPEAARFAHAAEVVTVPASPPELAFVLSAMAGHLFGYEAALAIDAQARPLRAARSVIDAAAGVAGDQLLATVGPGVAEAAAPFMAGLATGSYDGNLEASTGVRLVSLLRFATGVLPVDAYELETGRVGLPASIVADLLGSLNDAVDQLTRPVDAIKHQAKTVTVGISRSEEHLLAVRLVREALAAGAPSDALGYRALRTLGHLDRAVDEVVGFTRYRVDWPAAGSPPGSWPTARVVDQGGTARGLRSRTDSDPRLRGSKHRAADSREVWVVRGASDGRTVILVPEVKGTVVTGLTLLHARFHHSLPPTEARAVLTGYQGRYAALRDAVTETEPAFDDALLAEIPIVDLLTVPVNTMAERWRGRPS